MVEVIKYKNIVKCVFCDSILRYEKDDIKEKESPYYQFDSKIVKYIDCPGCGSEVIFSISYGE